MINVTATQASRLAPAARRMEEPEAPWTHFVALGVPPQELERAKQEALPGPNGDRVLRACCSPEPERLIELYSWLKRESIRFPIDAALIVIICDMSLGEEAQKAANGIASTSSKFLLLPTQINTHFY